MSTVEEDAEGKSEVGARRRLPSRSTAPGDILILRRQLAVAFTLNVLLLASFLGGINSVPFNRELFTGEWDRVMDEVDPELFRELTYDSGGAALKRANALLLVMGLGQVRTLAENVSDPVLYWDHSHGNILLWKLNDDSIEIWLDARTGEIVEYRIIAPWTGYVSLLGLPIEAEDIIEWPNTSVWLEVAVDQALAIARQFAVVPSDLVLPESVFGFHVDFTLPSGDLDGIRTETVDFWELTCERYYHGILTEDSMTMLFTQEGQLYHYKKDWFMDLDRTSTDVRLSERDAKQIALDEVYSVPWRVEDYNDWADTELEFIWSGPLVYDGPVLTWAVGFWSHHEIPERVFVDANTGEVLRSDIYD